METPNLRTVSQFVEKHPAFTNGSLRSLIFNAEANGLINYGGIIRVGRKVFIDEAKFFDWVAAQNRAA
jgi:hypothetical protein